MKSKKNHDERVLQKLRQFRKRWAGHEGIETAFGHVLLGPKENGVFKKSKTGRKK
jgi:hypothetical protein